MEKRILIINPGSTSTKLAVYQNLTKIAETTVRHHVEDIRKFHSVYEQKDFRLRFILAFLDEYHIPLESIDIFVGRGGLLRPLVSGTYQITEAMLKDLEEETYGTHACNLGAVLAYELAQPYTKPAYTVDPPVVDEMQAEAHVSGLKGLERKSIFHALNQKAVAKRYAREISKKYEDLNLIVAHLGGGVSIGLHLKGAVVDVNNALHGDGPLSPERSGSLPTYQLIDLCFSQKYTISEIKKMIVGSGGLMSYLGTSSGIEISERIAKGDQEAGFYLKAMVYQIAKEIGSLYFAGKGRIDAILITGGLAYNRNLIEYLHEYLDPILPPVLYPGEDEMLALAEGAYRVVTGEETLKIYA